MTNVAVKPEYDIFISYRWVSPDQEWVRDELFTSRQAARVRVLLDVEDFVPGRDLILEMTRAGLSSRIVLCVITPDYFEGNRMVSFEELAARRADPSGLESKLVPLILRKTELPDWMRGLIPLDWTDVEHHSREWRKLLKLLKAPYEDISPPAPLQKLSEGKRHHPDLEVISVHPMVATNDKGLGYQLILANRGITAVLICSADVHGWRKTETYGSDRMLRRVVFSVDLSCSQTAQSALETQTSIRGETYDDEPDWACVSEGSFKFALDTARSRKHWEYSLSVPISAAVLGKERIEIKLLFQRKDRRVVEQLAKGMSMGEYAGEMSEKHEIALRLEGDMIVRVPIDSSFLVLLANWEEPTVPSA